MTESMGLPQVFLPPKGFFSCGTVAGEKTLQKAGLYAGLVLHVVLASLWLQFPAACPCGLQQWFAHR